VTIVFVGNIGASLAVSLGESGEKSDKAESYYEERSLEFESLQPVQPAPLRKHFYFLLIQAIN
jgi:hypothetical protein